MIIITLHLVLTLLPQLKASGPGKKARLGFRRQSPPRTPLRASEASSE